MMVFFTEIKNEILLSEFVGVIESNGVDRFSTRTVSLDNLNGILNTANFQNGSIEVRRLSANENGESKDIYTGTLPHRQLIPPSIMQ